MSLRNKRKIVLLLLTLVVMLFSYGKDSLVVAFPKLSGLFSAEQKTSEVKGDAVFVSVVRVVDGDTIVVREEGKDEKVRLIGINTPETVDPRKPVECFGREAKEYLTRLLSGKNVRLDSDPTQQDRDTYGRLLRYIFLEDGTNVNERMIGEGFAYEYTYNLPYKFQATFKQKEKEAREHKRGLWGGGVCQGKQ